MRVESIDIVVHNETLKVRNEFLFAAYPWRILIHRGWSFMEAAS